LISSVGNARPAARHWAATRASAGCARSINGVQTSFDGLATYFAASGNTGASIELLADDSAGAYLVVTLE